MASISQVSPAGAAQSTARTGYPEASLRFDWLMTGLSALFMAGLWVDGWAHFHGMVDDSFFTPWHFLFYSSFGIVALFLGFHQLQNTRRGYAFTRALPPGYWLSLLGVALFAVGGLGDMIWHTLFGIEDGSEALTSPTHLMLALGMGLVFSGPLRSAWGRVQSGQMRGWVQLGPVLIVTTLLFTLLSFFISYVHPLVDPAVAVRASGARQDGGVIGIVITGALISAVMTTLVARWRLPFGAMTLLLGGNAALLVILNDFFVLIPAAVIAGLIADLLLLRWPPVKPLRLYAITFVVPVIYFAGYFLTVSQAARIVWSIHVWTGAAFLAGLAGLLTALVMTHGPRFGADS
jgi:hypothetical protein